MDEKLPYYMAYPMPLLYDDERQNQRTGPFCRMLGNKKTAASSDYPSQSNSFVY